MNSLTPWAGVSKVPALSASEVGAILAQEDCYPTTFEGFWRLGFRRLVPVIPIDAQISPTSALAKRPGALGKAVGIKGRDGRFHGFDWVKHEASEDDLPRWESMGVGIGLKMGEGIGAIDADAYDTESAKIIRDTIERRLGQLPTRVGQFPKTAYLFGLSAPLPYCRVEFGPVNEKGQLRDRVEILGDGRQLVVHGIHAVTNQPYAWTKPLVPRDQLPTFSPSTISALLEELRELLPAARPVVTEGATLTISQASLKGSIEAVRKAVEATPNTSALFGAREDYRDYGYAIKAALPDNEREAFDIFSSWCERWVGDDGQAVSPGNDPDVVASDWRRMRPPFRRGASYIYELAERHNPAGFKKIDAFFDEIDEPEAVFGVATVLQVEFPEPLDIFSDADPAELNEPPAGSLPPVIERWALSEAKRKGVPFSFAAAAAVGVISSAIGSSLKIRPRVNDDGWTEPASLWLAIVAPPGSAKSPIISAAVEPLRKMDTERWKQDQAKRDAWSASAKKKGKDAINPGAEPKVRRSVVDDVTMERQVRIHADNPRGVLRAPDELFGLIGSLGAYKKGSDGDRSQLLRLFEGREVTVDRVGAGSIRADSALMGVVAGTQPDRLKTIVRDMSNDGLLQRFLFILHDDRHREGLDELPDREALREYAAVVRGLASAEYVFCPPVRLTAEGYTVLADAVRRMSSLKYFLGAPAAWMGHVEKWGKFLPRIILTFHAIEQYLRFGDVDPENRVELATVNSAVLFGRFLLRHNLRFYETYFDPTEAASEAREVAGYMLTKGATTPEITRKTIYDARKDLRGPAKLFTERATRERLDRAARQSRIVEAGRQRREWLNTDNLSGGEGK